MNITEVTEITGDIIVAFEQLLPQLDVHRHPPSSDELTEIVKSPATVLFIARDDRSKPVGTVTLALFRIPTGVRAWIEDLVVDVNARDAGVGEALCRAAIQRAVAMGAVIVDLTCRPSREAAARLYERLGFVKCDTNVFRYARMDISWRGG